MENVDCRKLKEEGLKKLKELTKNKHITLKVIQVEGDKASDLYIKNKKNAAKLCGIEAEHILFKNNVTDEDIIDIIEVFNKDDSVNGIMVQLPLPKHLNPDKIINAIDKNKDVDGLTNENLGRIVSKEEGLRPCTAEGVMKILDNCIGLNNLKGKTVTIIGRSKLVGLPLFHMLLAFDATLTICHTKTNNLNFYTKNADIIITAAGAKKAFINCDMIKENSIIIDVSTVTDENGKFHGDVIYDEVINKAGYVSKVPGGVGQLTVLELMNNTYKAYLLQKNDD